MKGVRPVTFLLLAAMALLGLVVGWQVNQGVASPVEPSRGAVDRSDSVPAVPKLSSQLPPLTAFNDIAERPLFVQTRRPPAPAGADEVGSKNNPAPQWNLVGTAITSENRAALLFDTRNNKFLVMSAGMGDAGWELAEIEPEGVVLQNGEAKHEIKLPRF
ncbi:MAG: hypothetical protein OES09_15820 [Gammaproteobacteria bacterium]|nr:hypothetical protein [Gammaproteobacteria bacterium]